MLVEQARSILVNGMSSTSGRFGTSKYKLKRLVIGLYYKVLVLGYDEKKNKNELELEYLS